MTEIWKPVVGYEGYYEVSDIGRVRSVMRQVPVRASANKPTHFAQLNPVLLQQRQREDGRTHVRVALTKNGITKRFGIHRLVLEAFVGPCPAGMQTRHFNDIGNDNRLENLTWGTSIENGQDRVTNGIHWNTKKTHCKHGHEFTSENTYITSDRRRMCKACARRRAAA